MEKLKVEYVDIGDLKPYKNNAKLHTQEQIDQIKESISQFGMNDPIGVWKDGLIIEGHGRWMALCEMGAKEVPVIHLDHLSDEERRAYTLAHNKLTTNTGYDLELVNLELDAIEDIDMTAFGFDIESGGVLDDDTYTREINVPQYEITGEDVNSSELFDEGKANELVARINEADITDEEKTFLTAAASRHVVFNYRKIAEYYAKATPQMQALMEESALVIIDYNDAIKNGYVKISADIEEMLKEDLSDEA